jgi:spore germination protein YaaH
MTSIYNGTPHQINFYSKSDVEFDASQRKFIAAIGAAPIHTVAKGTPVNCKTANAPTPIIENCPVPVVGAVQFTSYDALPEGYDIYIVSNLYRSAVQALGGDTSKLATVTDTVYSATDIKPCGCLALAVG